MTFQQILDRVCQNLWGNTAAPDAQVTMLEGEYGIIAEMHRQIQREYNYWFMQTYSAVDSEVGVQTYPLPTDYKQMIKALWQTVDTEGTVTGFSNPLMPLGLGDAQKYFWKGDDSSTSEYPGYYEIFNNNIVIYPDPSEIRELHIVYWKFLPRPDDFDLSDDLTEYGANAIIDLATIELALILHEWEIVQAYQSKYERDILSLRDEDARRRQDDIAQVQINEF